jgi:SAM-dependent methyltransferase
MSFESEYWGDCCNTYDEDQKHYVYAQYMGLMTVGYSFSMSGKSVVDIGGGPTSMLLKTTNLGKGLVVDPLLYPQWTYARYDAKKIDCLVIRGEDFIGNDKFDEAWIYNCLQHTDDPELIIQNAKRAAKIVRIFEWVDIPPHEGHPIELTKENLDQWLGKEGSTTQLARAGCYGKAQRRQFHSLSRVQRIPPRYRRRLVRQR